MTAVFKYLGNFKITIIASLFLLPSCKKFIEVDPPKTSTTASVVYATDDMASSILTDIYAKISQAGLVNNNSINISFFSGLSADELTLYGASSDQTQISYYKNNLTTNPELFTDFWNNYYPIIFAVNTAIQELDKSKTLTPSIQQHLLGEAKFIRAFCYFHLVNLFGDVPLALGTDYEVNRLLFRSSEELVWRQIISDLKESQNLLSANYFKADIKTITLDRVRPTKAAAAALLARAYLYTGDFTNAEIQSSAIINNTSLYDTVSLNNVFLKNNKEAIWQLQPVANGWNTEDARIFVLFGEPDFFNPVYLSDEVVNAFEANDNRKTVWVSSVTTGSSTYFYPNKYKVADQNAPVTEYEVVLRLGEQFLIRAEARAHLNKISESQSDLNIIRKRAGLPNTPANDKTTLLAAILRERRVELFTEWGHRWFDLKRTGIIDAVMKSIAVQKGSTWETTDKLYPIPLADLRRNPNLTQNPGY